MVVFGFLIVLSVSFLAVFNRSSMMFLLSGRMSVVSSTFLSIVASGLLQFYSCFQLVYVIWFVYSGSAFTYCCTKKKTEDMFKAL